MAMLELVEAGQVRVGEARHELGRVREVLDRTDAVLAVTDDALESAESAIVTTRRATPYVLIGLGVMAAVAVGVIIWRRRQENSEE